MASNDSENDLDVIEDDSEVLNSDEREETENKLDSE
jgi:hypothetical protein